MGIFTTALRNAVHQSLTGEHRSLYYRPLGQELETALRRRVESILQSEIPSCPHGQKYSIDAVETRCGATADEPFLNPLPDSFDETGQDSGTRIRPHLTVRFVCAHRCSVATFAVDDRVILKAQGR